VGIPIKRMQDVRPLKVTKAQNRSIKYVLIWSSYFITQTPIVTVRELLELLMTIPNLAFQEPEL
jgi:hypothetical protein